MYRIILFLVLIALAAAGAAWVADQTGDVVLSWGGWRVVTTLPVFALALGVTVVAAMLAWSLLRALWRMPEKIRRSRRERRHARGRHAITHGLLAIGHGDAGAARGHADVARRHAAQRSAGAIAARAIGAARRRPRRRARARSAPWPSARTRGCWACAGCSSRRSAPTIRSPPSMIAEEALKLAPASTWASQAVLGFRCAKGDWSGALAILDNNLASGLIDKAAYRRQRGVLLTARALELENVDRDLSRDSVMEAVKLAPTLVPAAVLASKYQSEAHQVRRSMRIVEAAWLAHPHPDLADAYAHVKLGDSARQRLVRVETLAAKAPGHLEGALAVARAAIDATEFARAREALAPFIAAPTQRVAMLMAEIERTEHGDSGRARAWTLRAVRALHDPVWTADGYVSDSWRPVSPVTGRLDAFQWQTPLAALAVGQGCGDRSLAEFDEAMLSTPRRVEPPRESRPARSLRRPAAQDNSPVAPPAEAVESSTGRRAIPAAGRTRTRDPGAAVPRPRRSRQGRPGADSAGDSHRPRARRSRDRRRAGQRRIRGTSRSAAGPGRRLARVSVALGRLNTFRLRQNEQFSSWPGVPAIHVLACAASSDVDARDIARAEGRRPLDGYARA